MLHHRNTQRCRNTFLISIVRCSLPRPTLFHLWRKNTVYGFCFWNGSCFIWCAFKYFAYIQPLGVLHLNILHISTPKTIWQARAPLNCGFQFASPRSIKVLQPRSTHFNVNFTLSGLVVMHSYTHQAKHKLNICENLYTNKLLIVVFIRTQVSGVQSFGPGVRNRGLWDLTNVTKIPTQNLLVKLIQATHEWWSHTLIIQTGGLFWRGQSSYIHQLCNKVEDRYSEIERSGRITSVIYTLQKLRNFGQII